MSLILKKDLSLVEPSDLPHSANFQLIYEGRLKDYQNRGMKGRIQVTFPVVPVKM